MKKVNLKKIGVGSLAKVGLVFHGIFGLIAAALFTLVGLLGLFGGTNESMIGGVASIVMGFVFAIGYAILGAITLAIGAVVFNIITGIAGGIEFEFEEKQV